MSLVYCLYTVQVPASNRRPTALGTTARRPRAASGAQTRTVGAPEHTHRRTAARLAKSNHGHPHCEHEVGSVNTCTRERSSNSKPGVRHSLDAHYAALGRPQSVPASQPPQPMRWWGACSRDRPLRVDLPRPAVSRDLDHGEARSNGALATGARVATPASSVRPRHGLAQLHPRGAPSAYTVSPSA